MQVVSFETAKALKEAGFPQPSDWIDLDRSNQWDMFYVEPSEEGDAPGLYSLDRIDDIRTFGDPCKIIAYAPTATDLLPPGWVLVHYTDHWVAISAGSLINSVGKNYEDPYFTHDNPSEAAAMAWLFVKRNQPK